MNIVIGNVKLGSIVKVGAISMDLYTYFHICAVAAEWPIL
jgi:hypothetical protein